MSEDRKETKPPSGHKDWQKIAEQAANEQDSQKLLELVQRLCETIDKRNTTPRTRLNN
jgi:hypothetical protein